MRMVVQSSMMAAKYTSGDKVQLIMLPLKKTKKGLQRPEESPSHYHRTTLGTSPFPGKSPSLNSDLALYDLD